MNSNTKRALSEFADAVQQLSSAVMITTGIDTATIIADASWKLKEALAKDETILESH